MGAPPRSDWNRNLSSRSTSPVRKLAESIYFGTRDAFPYIWIGRGWDKPYLRGPYPTSGQWGDEHGTGRALDIICSPEVGIRPSGAYRDAGDKIVAWLISNAWAMHIRHIIWQDRIYKTRYGNWMRFTGDRSNISARHEDHIHVFFEDSNGTIPAFNAGSTQEGFVLNENTKNEMAGIVDHAIWDTHIPNHGSFAKAFEALADRVKELSQDLADVRRGGADAEYRPVNQEVADDLTLTREIDARTKEQEAKLASLETKVDKLAAGLEALLRHAGVAAE